MKALTWVLYPLLYVQASVMLGLAAFPGVWLCHAAWQATSAWGEAPRLLLLSVLGAASYFLFGFSLMILVVLARVLFFLRVEPGRHPFFSLGSVKWATYNTLILFVRFTFLDWVRVTPFLPLFYRLMGARVGKGVQINSKIIADVCLLEIGDGSVIGGDVTLICHAAERGHLVIAPVKIGKKVDIGLMAVILPGVEIGDGAVIGAHALLPKHTQVPAGTMWGGVPARQLRPSPEAEPSAQGL